jgi:hypothetical protein
MTKKGLIFVVVIWVILTLINYYYMNFFFLAFIWLGLNLTLLILALIQLVKTIKDRKTLTRLHIVKLVMFSLLFILTLYRHKTNLAIEKVDWLILQNRRNEIVDQVKIKELNPNVSWNNWICELPFKFPVVSNGGNDIGISRNIVNNGTTVTFWVFRNFFNSPSIYFVYTDDPEEIKRLDKEVAKRPNDNWKIKENWYRKYGE